MGIDAQQGPACGDAATAPDEDHPADREDAGTRTVRGGALRVSGYAVGTVLSLIGMIYVTRALGPGDFGRFQTVLNIILVVGIVSDVGLGMLGVREYTTAAPEDRRRLMRALLGLRLILTAAGVGIATAVVALAGASPVVIFGIVVSGLGLLIAVIQSTLVIPLQSALRFLSVTTLDVARQGVQALAYVAIAVAGIGLVGFYAVAIPVQVVLLVVTAAVCWGVVSIIPSLDWPTWRRLLTAGLAFALAAAVGVIYQYTAQIITAVVSTETEAGLFAAALRIYVVAGAIPGLVIGGALPILARSARDNAERFGYAMRLLTDASLAGGGLLGIVLVVGAPLIIDIVGGEEFADAVWAMRLLGGAAVISALIAAWGIALIARHQHRALVVANSIALASSLVLSAVLAAAFGATGAAVATLAVETVLAIAYAVFVVRGGSVAMPAVRTYLVVAAAFVVAVAIALVPQVPVLVLTIAAAVLYALVVMRARILPRELLEAAPERLRRYGAWGVR